MKRRVLARICGTIPIFYFNGIVSMPLPGRSVPRYERHQPQEHDCTGNRRQQASERPHRNPSDQRDEPSAQNSADKPDGQIDHQTRSASADYLACDPAGEQADYQIPQKHSLTEFVFCHDMQIVYPFHPPSAESVSWAGRLAKSGAASRFGRFFAYSRLSAAVRTDGLRRENRHSRIRDDSPHEVLPDRNRRLGRCCE